MNKIIKNFVISSLTLATLTAHGQAIDSTGSEKLYGVSGRVTEILPPAIPGPVGPAGPAGPSGATGSTGTADVPQGSACGLARYVSGTAANTIPTGLFVDNSCQGYPIVNLVFNRQTLKYDATSNCPPGYLAFEVGYKEINNGAEGSTNSTLTTVSYSCFKR